MKYKIGQNVKIIGGSNTGKFGIIQTIFENEYKIRLISCAIYCTESQIEKTLASKISW